MVKGTEATSIICREELSLNDIVKLAILDDLLGYLAVGQPQKLHWAEWPRRVAEQDMWGFISDNIPRLSSKPYPPLKSLTMLRDAMDWGAYEAPVAATRVGQRLYTVWIDYLKQTSVKIEVVTARRTCSSDPPAPFSRVITQRFITVPSGQLAKLDGLDTVVVIAPRQHTKNRIKVAGLDEDCVFFTQAGEPCRILLGPGSHLRDSCNRYMWITSSDDSHSSFSSTSLLVWKIYAGKELFRAAGQYFDMASCPEPRHKEFINSFVPVDEEGYVRLAKHGAKPGHRDGEQKAHEQSAGSSTRVVFQDEDQRSDPDARPVITANTVKRSRVKKRRIINSDDEEPDPKPSVVGPSPNLISGSSSPLTPTTPLDDADSLFGDIDYTTTAAEDVAAMSDPTAHIAGKTDKFCFSSRRPPTPPRSMSVESGPVPRKRSRTPRESKPLNRAFLPQLKRARLGIDKRNELADCKRKLVELEMRLADIQRVDLDGGLGERGLCVLRTLTRQSGTMDDARAAGDIELGLVKQEPGAVSVTPRDAHRYDVIVAQLLLERRTADITFALLEPLFTDRSRYEAIKTEFEATLEDTRASVDLLGSVGIDDDLGACIRRLLENVPLLRPDLVSNTHVKALARLQADIALLQSAEDQLEEEAERFRTDLVGVRTELEFAQAEIGRYKAQAAEMELQLVSARNQASTAREARATAHQDAQKWLKRGEASQEAAKRLKDELAKLKADAEEKAELAQKASVAREAKGLALLEAEKGKVQTLQTELESAKKALEKHIADMAPRPQSAAATEASSGVGVPPAPGRMDLSAGIQHVARLEANIVALETAHATTTSAWIAERQRLEDERNEMTASKTELQGQLRTAAESIRALRQKCDTSKQEINDARGNEAIYRDLCRKLEGDLRSAKAASMVNAAAPMPAVRIASEATGSSAAVGQLGRHVSGSAQLVAQLPQQGVSDQMHHQSANASSAAIQFTPAPLAPLPPPPHVLTQSVPSQALPSVTDSGPITTSAGSSNVSQAQQALAAWQLAHQHPQQQHKRNRHTQKQQLPQQQRPVPSRLLIQPPSQLPPGYKNHTSHLGTPPQSAASSSGGGTTWQSSAPIQPGSQVNRGNHPHQAPQCSPNPALTNARPGHSNTKTGRQSMSLPQTPDTPFVNLAPTDFTRATQPSAVTAPTRLSDLHTSAQNTREWVAKQSRSSLPHTPLSAQHAPQAHQLQHMLQHQWPASLVPAEPQGQGSAPGDANFYAQIQLPGGATVPQHF